MRLIIFHLFWNDNPENIVNIWVTDEICVESTEIIDALDKLPKTPVLTEKGALYCAPITSEEFIIVEREIQKWEQEKVALTKK